MFIAVTNDWLVLRGYMQQSSQVGSVRARARARVCVCVCVCLRARVCTSTCVGVYILKVHTARVKQSIRACAKFPLPSDTMSGGVYGGGKYVLRAP